MKSKKIISITMLICLIIIGIYSPIHSFFPTHKTGSFLKALSLKSSFAKDICPKSQTSDDYEKNKIILEGVPKEDRALEDMEDTIDEISKLGMSRQDREEMKKSIELAQNKKGRTYALATIPEGTTVSDTIEVLEDSKPVKEGKVRVQPNYMYRLADIKAFTSYNGDSSAAAKFNWHLTNVNCKLANNYVRQNAVNDVPVKIGVIDTGAQINHPALKSSINKKLSISLSNKSNYTKLKKDKGVHGTHVAGIIAGKNIPGKKWRGIAYGSASIVAVDASSYYYNDIVFYTFDLISALNYCRDSGCKIINMSLSGTGRDTVLEKALESIDKSGILVVCAAGNDNSKNYVYPGDIPTTLSICNTNIENKRYDSTVDGSNYGYDKSMSAPGTNIYSSIPNGNYAFMTGTSMSSPLVAGTAVLMLKVNPELTNRDLKVILKSTSQDIDNEGYDIYTGFGLLDAYRAVEIAKKYNLNSYWSPEIILSRKSAKLDISGKLYCQYAFDLKIGCDYLPKVQWRSDDPTVATVNDEGEVLGKKEGTTKITCFTDKNRKSFTVKVLDSYPTIIGKRPFRKTFKYNGRGFYNYYKLGKYDGFTYEGKKGEYLDICTETDYVDSTFYIIDEQGNLYDYGTDINTNWNKLNLDDRKRVKLNYTGKYYIQVTFSDTNYRNTYKISVLSSANSPRLKGRKDKNKNNIYTNYLRWKPIANVEMYKVYRKKGKRPWKKIAHVKQPLQYIDVLFDYKIDKKGVIVNGDYIKFRDKIKNYENSAYSYKIVPGMKVSRGRKIIIGGFSNQIKL